MPFTVNTKEFIRELEWTARFVEAKTTIPILNNVLFRKRGDVLRFVATDLSVAGATNVAIAEHVPDFELCIPVKSLLKYLKRVEDASLTLDPDVRYAPVFGPHVEKCKGPGTIGCCHEPYFLGGALAIRHGVGGAVKIDAMDSSSYPEIPTMPPASLAIGGLSKAIARSLIAISPEESRFTLNGALLEVNKTGEAQFIATDGHRLSVVAARNEGAPPETIVRMLIPKAALAEIVRLGDSALISTDEHHAFFAFGDRTVTARKLTGNFPDWERVMPTDLKFSVTAPAARLRNVIERVAVLADERSHAVEVSVNGAMTITTRQNEQSATGEVPIVGPHFVVPYVSGFNALYMLDYLKALDAPECEFRFFNPKNAAEFRADGWRYVLMPFRLGDAGENPVAEGEFEPVPFVIEALGDPAPPPAVAPAKSRNLKRAKPAETDLDKRLAAAIGKLDAAIPAQKPAGNSAPPVTSNDLPRPRASIAHPHHPKAPNALRESALRLKADGLPLAQIAAQLNAPQSSVWRWTHAAIRA